MRLRPNIDAWFDSIVHPEAENWHTWEDWAEIADLVENTDFGCNFDCEGKCKEPDNVGEPGRSCCGHCADTKGYLRVIPAEALETVKAEYDEKDGFWRPTGCALPAKYRSHTCLAYRCDTATDADSINVKRSMIWKHFNKLFASQAYYETHLDPACRNCYYKGECSKGKSDFDYSSSCDDYETCCALAITMGEVKRKMQEVGLVRKQQLVTIS